MRRYKHFLKSCSNAKIYIVSMILSKCLLYILVVYPYFLYFTGTGPTIFMAQCELSNQKQKSKNKTKNKQNKTKNGTAIICAHFMAYNVFPRPWLIITMCYICVNMEWMGFYHGMMFQLFTKGKWNIAGHFKRFVLVDVCTWGFRKVIYPVVFAL